MKKALLILLCVVVVLIGAALALPFVIPTETYKQQLAAEVERVTGRKLDIQGPLHLSLLPTVALEAENVRFANVSGAADPDMAKLKALEVELKVWPLLHGSVEVARFVLVKPVIHLEVTKTGQPNWQFGPKPAGEAKPAPAGGGGASSSSGLPISEIKLGDVRIEDGTLTYAEATSGVQQRFDAINVSLQLPDLKSPLQANGSLDYKTKTIKLDLKLDQPLEVIQGGSSPLRLAVDSKPARIGFDGELSNGAEPSAKGGLDLSVPSIRELAAWLSEPLKFQGQGLQTLTIKGKVDGSPKRIALSDVAIGLDDIAAKGELVADLGGKVPKVNGRLDLGAVDLNPYLPPAAADGGEPAARRQEAAGGRREDAVGSRRDAGAGRPAAGGRGHGQGLVRRADRAAAARRRQRRLRTDPGFAPGQGARARAHRARTDPAGRHARGGAQGTGALRRSRQRHAPGRTRERRAGDPQQFKLDGLHALPFLTAAAGVKQLEGTARHRVRVDEPRAERARAGPEPER